MNAPRILRSLAVPVALAALSLLGAAGVAHALPRFAARAGTECIQCHVNPSGGGVRSSYGRLFARTWLPFSSRETASDLTDSASPAPASPLGSFSGEITDWLALGADLRAAYLWIRPDRGLMPGTRPTITTSFFLMQGVLYLDAAIEDHVTMMLSYSVYQGIEAWGLLRLKTEPSSWNLLLKAGRFMPAFGIREVEHQLYTRQGIGLGNADRDTGVELTALLGPVTLQLGFTNGTIGLAPLDTAGTEARSFQKALIARAAWRLRLGPLRAQIGGDFYYSGSVADANPLFAGGLPAEQMMDVAAGLDEYRGGGFVTASLGRFAYLGDLAVVRDVFFREALAPITGYASYQELSFVPVQGIDVITTLEFKDRDVQITGDWSLRSGFAVEFFPWPFTEVRAMLRREWSQTSPTGGTWDVVLFLHLFM